MRRQSVEQERHALVSRRESILKDEALHAGDKALLIERLVSVKPWLDVRHLEEYLYSELLAKFLVSIASFLSFDALRIKFPLKGGVLCY